MFHCPPASPRFFRQRGQYAPGTVLSLRDSTLHLALPGQRGYCHTPQFLWASTYLKSSSSFSVKSLLFLLPAYLFTPPTALIHPINILEGN